MRVLHVLDAVSWRYGGTPAAVLPLCAALARQPGVSVELWATDADGPRDRLASPPDQPFPIRLFWKNFGRTWKYSRTLGRELRARAGEYNLVHTHGVWSYATTAAGAAARGARVPYVLSPHGMLSRYTWSRSVLSAAQKRAYWALTERANVRGAARLHLTSAGEGREMEPLRLGVPVSTIPLGLDASALTRPADRHWLRKRLGGRDRGRPIVLFLSRLHPKKGVVEFLLPAFRALRADAFLVIAGGADPHAGWYEEAVRSAVSALGLEERVHLLGPVSADDRWAAFDGADLFVLPSRQENFGLVITEAMARGVPVIASEHAYAGEHLERAGGAGCVVPLAVEPLTAAMARLLADSDARAQMGAAGRAYAPRLNWDYLAEEFVAMYRECLSAPPDGN